MNTEHAESILGPRGHVGRARRAPGQLWQVPLFLTGLAALIGVALTAPSRGENPYSQIQSQLSQLRHGLQPGRDKPATLVQQAEELLAGLSQFPRKAGDIHFLAGSAYFRLAQQSTGQAQAASQAKAIHHLEQARALGVVAADLPVLRYRLGFSLYQHGKDQKNALELMSQSIDKGADRPGPAYGLLARAFLALPNPNLEAALGASQKQLELTDDRNAEEMASARLLHGKLLLVKDQKEEALKTLALIGSAAPASLRLEAGLLQAKICEEQGLWNRAAGTWEDLLAGADAVKGGKARVLYSLGVAYSNGGPPRWDRAKAVWQEAFALGGDEGLAAGIRLGKLLLDCPDADAAAALTIWTSALADVGTPNDYHIRSLELSRAREILDAACQFFLAQKDYEHTRLAAELYKKIAPAGVAEERIAQAAEGLARDGAEKLKAAGVPQNPAEQEKVRSQFHQAGLAYEQAALARLAENQPEIYWRSAQCYLMAKDFRQAVTVLQKYVGVEKIERRLAEAYLAMAEALVALEDRAGAREAFEKCLEYPATPFAFRARYEWALQEIESKDYAKALKILEDNLDSSGPVHDRPAHEKSLFKVAELYHALGQFDKAHIAYSEALVQYPTNPGVPVARQRLAQCYQELAKREKEKLDGAKDSTAKANYQATRQDWLVKGAKEFEQLADALEHKAKAGGQPLTHYEEHLLASALIGAADIQYDLGDFHETLRRCEVIQGRFRKQAAGLLAFQRIMRTVGVLTQSSEDRRRILTAAAESLKMAKADLAEMPEDSDDFRGQGVYDKATWRNTVRICERWLQDLEGALMKQR